jgi:hypothetical protein
MDFSNGLLGLGGFKGLSSQPKTTGLLGQYYDPEEMRRMQMKQGLLGAGIALLSGENLGGALAGGLQGAKGAQSDYMEQAKMAYDMDRQARNDTWENTVREREMKKFNKEDEAEEARRNFALALPEDQRALAEAYPDAFGELYAKSKLTKMFPEAEKPTDDMREYNTAVGQGFQGSFMDYMTAMKKAGATNVNVNGDQKLTEGQSKDVNFYSRGKYANADLEQNEEALLSLGGNMASGAGVVGNYLKDPKYRQAERAGREVLAVILRKDTGAAVTEQEFDLYGPMYLPWPGDDAQTILDKREARNRAMGAIKLGGGTARPIFDEIDKEFEANMPKRAPDSPMNNDPLGLR